MSKNIETAGDWHWRNTMKTIKFFAIDARAAATFMLVLMHARLWTLYLFVVVCASFTIIERFGLTLPSALRALRSWIVGNRRPALMHTRKNKLIDYG